MITSPSPLSDLTSFRINEHSLKTEIRFRDPKRRYKSFDAKDADDRDEIFETLRDILGDRATESRVKRSKFTAVLKPLLFTLAIGAGTWILTWSVAHLDEDGGSLSPRRNMGLRLVIMKILELLGPVVIGIVGGFLTLVCILWTLARFTRPPVFRTLKC